MKLKINLFLLICFCLLSGLATAQKSTKVLHHFYVMQGACKELYLDLASENIKILRTSGSRVLVELHVNINTNNDKLLDYLARQGRYEMTFVNDEKDPTKAYLNAKKDAPKIRIRGEQFREEHKYILHVPEKVGYIAINGKELNTTAFKE